MKKRKGYIFAAIFLAAMFFLHLPAKIFRMKDSADYQRAEIVRVVDGDTLVVSVDGRSVRVRLIGVDCEESTMKDECLNTEKGRCEAEFVRDLLPAGTEVYLQKDVSETDRYDRLLRYVWLEIPEDAWNVEEVRTKMLNGILVDQMNTRVDDYPPDVLYSEILWKIQKISP